jgi:16S rRNA (guanine527-N7)-methyltransferase
MDTARIAALLQPFLRRVPNACHSDPASADISDPCHSEPAKAGEEPAVLSPAQLQSISTYIDILLRWNARINLSAIRDPEEIVQRHFGESLFGARNLFPKEPTAQAGRAQAGREGHSFSRAASVREEESTLAPESADAPRPTLHARCSVADIGSGAGFPGMPLKLWAPQISLTLIESNHKKATFLREVVRSLALTNVNIKNARAESINETFDVVTLRAVEDFASILPTAAALVAPAGRLALLISSVQIEPASLSLPHFSWSAPIPIPLSTSRVVLTGCRRP